MAMYDTWSAAFDNNNLEALAKHLHEDFVFVRHQSGAKMNKKQMLQMLDTFMKSDELSSHDRRCLYENDDVLVEHSVVDFPDGSSEAILTCLTKSGGRFIRMETGATLLDEA